MKKLSLFILFIAVLSTISCKKDDESSGPNFLEINEANLVGKWNLISEDEDGDIFTIEACGDQYIMDISIKEDGSNLLKFTEYTMIDQKCTPSISVDYVWELSDNRLTEYIHDETAEDNRLYEENYTIIELTDTTLKLESTETYTENGEEKTSVYIETFSKI